ncbi:MAG: pyridoxine kinase PdxK [Rhodobacteraceae bacterium HLUCCO18]|nr:MAG: pyridoxine kinase PdxK [Rhodobacteraceae bacterium HLUCCO18]
MAHVVAVSSWVAHGHVGLSAAAPVLQALGHSVTQLPTVQLSNHPGWPHVAGRAVDVGTLGDMADALARNGWLDRVDAVLTGYLPSAAHVAFAAGLIERLRAASPAPRVIVDPILGDAPKGLYIPEEAARATRERLLPLADVLTPNAFELSWLAARPVETLEAARQAAEVLHRAAPRAEILVTSPPIGDGQTGILADAPEATALYRTELIAGDRSVPHGVGDAFSALIAGSAPVGTALGQLRALIACSVGAPHLRIAESAGTWTRAAPIDADPSGPLTGGRKTR